MNKQAFLAQLRKGLSGLPKEDIEERVTFYSDMIDDRVEDGLSEAAAIVELGSVDAITEQIIADTPLAKLVKEKITPKKRLAVWEIILLVLGSPIWLSLLIVALAVIFVIYVLIWTVVVCLWAVFAALVASLLAGIAGGIVFIIRGDVASGIALICAGLVCAGLSVFMFVGCKAATKLCVKLTKKIALWIKSCFMKKEVA